MKALEHDDATCQPSIAAMLGWGGLLLGIAGATAILLLGGNGAIATAILAALVATAALTVLPQTRHNPVTWLITAIWTAAIGVIGIFSVGIIFLIATVFLLAAFVRANW